MQILAVCMDSPTSLPTAACAILPCSCRPHSTTHAAMQITSTDVAMLWHLARVQYDFVPGVVRSASTAPRQSPAQRRTPHWSPGAWHARPTPSPAAPPNHPLPPPSHAQGHRTIFVFRPNPYFADERLVKEYPVVEDPTRIKGAPGPSPPPHCRPSTQCCRLSAQPQLSAKCRPSRPGSCASDQRAAGATAVQRMCPRTAMCV